MCGQASPQNANVKLKFVCYGTAQLWQGKDSNQNLAPYSFELEPNIVKHLTNQYLDKNNPNMSNNKFNTNVNSNNNNNNNNNKGNAHNDSLLINLSFPKNSTTTDILIVNETELALTSESPQNMRHKGCFFEKLFFLKKKIIKF